jgi:hypothetical protein
MATIVLMLILAVEEGDDGHGTERRWRSSEAGRHGAADAAIHASSQHCFFPLPLALQ